MSVDVICERCQHEVTVPDDNIGTRIRCPKCKANFTAELPPGASDAEELPIADQTAPAPLPEGTERRDKGAAPQAEEPKERKKVPPAPQALLRFTILYAGLLGAVACGFLFYLWQRSDTELRPIMGLARALMRGNENDPKFADDLAKLKQFELQRKAYPFVLLAAFAGVIGGLMGSLRVGGLAALVMVAGAVAPAIILPRTLLFTAPLIVGAALALMVQSQARANRNAKLASEEPRKRVRLQHPLVVAAAILGLLALLPYTALLAHVLPTAMENQEREIAKLRGQDAGGNADTGTEPSKAAGAGAKLVKLDLSPAGLEATLDAPEGCVIKESSGTIHVTKDEHFTLRIDFSRRGINSARSNNSRREVLVNTPDLVLTKGTWGKNPDHSFAVAKVLGHRDVSVQNGTHVNGKLVEHNHADCLLMIRCAESLAPKAAPPADPTAALAPFKAAPRPGQDRPNEIRLNAKATDATLALLAKFPDTKVLDLSAAEITDDGIAHLSGLSELEELNISRGGLTDASAPHLAKLKRLKVLDASSNNFTDEGLKALGELPELEVLDLNWSLGFKGPGLAHLKGAKNLMVLRLRGGGREDDTLAHLKDLTTLTDLDLSNSKVLGPGLAQLNRLPILTRLSLGDTKINDVGLAGATGLFRLEELDLHGTELTGPGLAHLKNMSRLKVLKLDSSKVTDDGVAHLADLSALEVLNLNGTPVTDAAAAHLKGLKNLRVLNLGSTGLTDAGLKQLDALENLDELELWGSKVTNAVQPMKVKPPVVGKLKPADPQALVKKFNGKVIEGPGADKPILWIAFNEARITDADLADLRELTTLRVLNLGSGTDISDAGLFYLKGLTDLEELHLHGTKVQGDGLVHLAKLTKLKRLVLPGNNFSAKAKRFEPSGDNFTAKQLAPLAALVNLEEFQCNLNAETEAKLQILSGMTKLRTITLPRGLTDKAMEHVGKMVGLESLHIPTSGVWRLTDVGLAHLKNLKNLKALALNGAAVTGEGFKHLAGLTGLENLHLDETPFGDEGLKHIRALTGLRTLNLTRTFVTDAGLPHLGALVNLRELHLGSTRVTGTGFEKLQKMPKVELLDVAGAPFSDAGMKQLGAFPGVRTLDLDRTDVTDAGIEQLKGMNQLTRLSLFRTRIRGTGFAAVGELPELTDLAAAESDFSDAGLESLAALKQLNFLDLSATPVTGTGFAKLKGLKELRDVLLRGSQLSDAGLKQLGELSGLEEVGLGRTRITDTGLPALDGLTKLHHLDLEGTNVTGAGLKDVKALTKVTSINLNRSRATDNGLEYLKNFSNLTDLQLEQTLVTDAGLGRLKEVPKLRGVNLKGTQITDAGLSELSGVKTLQNVNASQTQSTTTGAEKLKKALPDVRVSVGE